MTTANDNIEYSQYVDEFYQFHVKIYPALLTYAGENLKGFQPVSYEENLEIIEKYKEFLKKIVRFKNDELSDRQENSKKCLIFMMTSAIDNFKYFWLQFPLAPYTSSPILNFNGLLDFEFQNHKNLQDYLNLLDALVKLLNDLLVFTKSQVEKGILMPKPELELVIPMWQSFAHSPEESILMVSDTRLTVYDEKTRIDFINTSKNKVLEQIIPCINAIVTYLQGEYKSKAPESVGMWQYPDGPAAYLNAIKANISYEWSPEEIHQLGLDQIQYLNNRIEKIMKTDEIEGNVDSIYHKINIDPSYCNQPPDKIKKRYDKFLGVMKEIIPTIFKTQPKAPGVTERLPLNLEKSMTFGYYEPPVSGRKEGKYYYNASNVGGKLYLQIPAIALHELYPGHHFQIMSNKENESLDKIQKMSFINSYNEGWAEYASNLGFEYKIISDPMDIIGGLFGRKMFAIRLVVDTGLNYLKWSLEKARKYMRENHFGDESMIKTESLRYSCDMPSQALAYRIGFLQIYKFREEIRKQLGKKFDIKEFHEAVLEYGAQPLIILEEHLKKKLL